MHSHNNPCECTRAHMHAHSRTCTPIHSHISTHTTTHIRTRTHTLTYTHTSSVIGPGTILHFTSHRRSQHIILIFLVISSVPRLYLDLKWQMSAPLRQLWLAFTVDNVKAELTLPVCALQFQTLRGSHWRGRDCNDSNKMAYPGRR